MNLKVLLHSGLNKFTVIFNANQEFNNPEL
jgi:hypothetical protein